MPIQIVCPACRRSLRVPEELVGQVVKCPACLSEFAASTETSALQLDPAIRAAEHLPPPARLPAPPERFDDEWNDDFAMRRRGIDRDRARSEVFWPAMGLITTSAIGLLIGIFLLALGITQVKEARTPPEKTEALRGLIEGPVAVASSFVILLGGISMMRLKNHGLATTSAVLAFTPCTSPCCVIGMPVGVWAMTMLNRSEIKRAFN